MTIDHIHDLIARAEAYGLDLGPHLADMTPDEIAAAYNGIGAEWMPAPIRDRLTTDYADLEPSAMIHDVDYRRANGSITEFHAANARLRANIIATANAVATPFITWRWWRLRLAATAYFEAVERIGLIAYVLSQNQNQERNKTMNKTMMLAALIGCAIALTGCVSEELTWGGQKAVRQPDGTVLVDQTTGKPYYEKDQNHLARFSHLTDAELKELHVKADAETYEAHLGHLGSFCGSNTVAVINASVGGAAKLVAEAGALYAKIAGGASADVISSLVGKAVALFKSQGGNVDTAAAAIDGNQLKITDGKTCVTCDANGNCTAGACSE